MDGDQAALDTLLREDPLLAHSRSLRDHRSTLLHYVSANGVEDDRQKTPGNILSITERLLGARADVNAESEAYGGGSTTLLLAATSVHPERAGVQLPLLQLLLDHGARIERHEGGSSVIACLRNGRAAAAEFLAARGARLDLEGAAGVGHLAAAEHFLLKDGALSPDTRTRQLAAGFGWACQFGQLAMVELLLLSGMRADAVLKETRETGLHHAALGGHVEIINKLLDKGGSVHVRETRFNGTPLGWALYGWGNRAPGAAAERYYESIAILVRAGASTSGMPAGFVDSRMQAALRGQYFGSK